MSNMHYIDLYQQLISSKSPREQKRRFVVWAGANDLALTADEKVAMHEATDAADEITTNKTSKGRSRKGERVAFYVRNTDLALCTHCNGAIDSGEPVFLKLLQSNEEGLPIDQRKSHPRCTPQLADGLGKEGKRTYERWLTGGAKKRTRKDIPRTGVLERLSPGNDSASAEQLPHTRESPPGDRDPC